MLIKYLIIYIVLQALLFVSYKLLLARTTNFNWNRWFILSFPLLPMLLVGIPSMLIKIPFFESFYQPLENINVLQLDPVLISNQLKSYQILSEEVLLLSYLAGCMAITISAGITFFTTYKLILKLKKEGNDGANGQIVVSEHPLSFSYFNFIHINNNHKNDSGILRHEMSHRERGHSWDLIWYQLMKIIGWCNPFVWLMEKELRLVHEYQADLDANEVVNQQQYVNSMLNQQFGTQNESFILPFFRNQKSIIMRLKMLKQSKSNVASGRVAMMLAMMIVLGIWGCSTSNTDSMKSDLMTADGSNEKKVQQDVDQMPQFDEANGTLVSYIQENFSYPKEAYEAKKEGKVMVRFTISSKGQVEDVNIAKSADPMLDKAAKELVASMPEWKPGQKEGKSVPVEMVLPIVFKI